LRLLVVSSSGPFFPCAEAATPRWSLDPAFDVRVTAMGTTATAMPVLDELSDDCNGFGIPARNVDVACNRGQFLTVSRHRSLGQSKELVEEIAPCFDHTMGKIATIEYFRVPPRWLFVKITDADGNFGWGEASLEGHTQAVEGCLDAWAERYVGLEAEYVVSLYGLILIPFQHRHISTPAKIEENDEG
jgi:hypothetical protein